MDTTMALKINKGSSSADRRSAGAKASHMTRKFFLAVVAALLISKKISEDVLYQLAAATAKPPSFLSDDGSSAMPKDTDDEIKNFLKEHPNTPGARFIELWNFKYRGNSTEEIQRLMACGGMRGSPQNAQLCLAGTKEYSFRKSRGEETQHLSVPLWENQTDIINTYTIERAGCGTKWIPSLGTYSSCIPLLLAGYSALSTQPDRVVVELGPFAGFSSKCIVTGMAKHGHIDNSYVAFDTFEGRINFNAISSMAKWTVQENSNFTSTNTDFLWVWQQSVHEMYPEAEGRPGWSSKDTVNHAALGNKDISMVSIDSAKRPIHFVKQQEGILPIKAGTIWFLMDYGSVHTQIRRTYGCMRDYLFPVFAHWEQWAFVVKKDITALQGPELVKCFEDIISNIPQSLVPLKQQMDHDFKHLLGLDQDSMSPEELTYFKNKIHNPQMGALNDTSVGPWSLLAQKSRE